MQYLETQVAVLGAGWAGVAATYHLVENGIADVLLVEGGAHVGGRSRKFDDFGGYTVEDGSNWIQGTGNLKKENDFNPIWELANEYGLGKVKKKKHPFKSVGGGTVTQNYESYAIYDRAGERVADKDIRWDDLEEGFECHNALGTELNLQFWETGVWEEGISQGDLLRQCGWDAVTPIDDVTEYFEMDWEWGSPPDETSGYASPVWGYGDFEDEDEFVIDQRGFQHLAESLLGEVFEEDDDRLMMETLVTNIDWEPSSCPQAFSSGCVEITASSASDGPFKIVAEFAIVTFSSGVLKHDHETLFTPALPATNLNALNKLKTGLYTKVFFQFEEKFWDDTEFILIATEFRADSPLWQSLDMKKQLQGSRILFVTLTGEEGVRAETLTEDEVKEEQLAYLRTAYGDAVTEPINFHIARFLNDPLFRLAWGDWGLETPPNVSDLIRTPLVNQNNERKVYLSGESTCRRYYGFTHGGYLAGKRDALEIMNEMGMDVGSETACENQNPSNGGPPYGNPK